MLEKIRNKLKVLAKLPVMRFKLLPDKSVTTAKESFGTGTATPQPHCGIARQRCSSGDRLLCGCQWHHAGANRLRENLQGSASGSGLGKQPAHLSVSDQISSQPRWLIISHLMQPGRSPCTDCALLQVHPTHQAPWACIALLRLWLILAHQRGHIDQTSCTPGCRNFAQQASK